MATVTVGGREYETIYKGTDGSYYIPDSRFSGQFIPFSPGSASKRTINSGGLNILALPSLNKVTAPMSYREEVAAGVNVNADRTSGFYGIKPPESTSTKTMSTPISQQDYFLRKGESISDYNARISALRSGTNKGTSGVITDNVTGNRYTLGPNGTYIPYLPPSSAPSNAGQIGTPMGSPQFGSTSPSIGNVAGAYASSQSMLPGIDMKMADYERQLASAERAQEQTQKGLLNFLRRSPSQTEMREDAYRDIGINPTNYFADQKARIAEIDSLTQAYNEQVAAKDAAIAASYDKLASNSFINNQIGQIERNAAPRLNQMSANINSKAAVLQALQGNFAEARSFVSQAVEDAVADKKFQVDLFTMMYDMNKDKINRLDKKYSEAYSYAFDLAKMEYENAREDRQKVGELLLQNPQAGISIGDSLDEAYRKIGVNPNSPERRLLEAQIANTLDNANDGSDEDPGTAYISIMQEAINNGASPEEAARAAARVSEDDGIPVSQATLNSWVQQAQSLTPVGSGSTQVPRIDSRSTLSYLPSATRETIGSFFSNLFGG